MSVTDRIWYWWYRLLWWTPEAKAIRAWHRYAECVTCQLLLRGTHPESVDRLTIDAFLALHREYVDGRKIRDPRAWAIDYALSTGKTALWHS